MNENYNFKRNLGYSKAFTSYGGINLRNRLKCLKTALMGFLKQNYVSLVLFSVSLFMGLR